MAMLNAYLDESGNSGRNYLDSQQPFYVIGGWAIDADNVVACREAVTAWESALGSGTEMKSSALLRRPSGVKKSIELMSSLISAGAAPTCCVMEKRFGICMNIAETFFPGWAGDIESMPDTKARRGMAEYLCSNIGDDLLVSFARAVYDRDLKALAVVRDSLARRLMILGQVPPGTLEAIPIEDIASFPFSGTNGLNSINATVFHSQIMILEHLCREKGFAEWRAFHDETASFEEVLRLTAEHLRHLPNKIIRQSNGLTIYAGELRLTELVFGRSHEEALIRGADQYAGLMNFLFKKLLSGDTSDIEGNLTLRPLFNATNLGLPALQFFNLSPETDKTVSVWI